MNPGSPWRELTRAAATRLGRVALHRAGRPGLATTLALLAVCLLPVPLVLAPLGASSGEAVRSNSLDVARNVPGSLTPVSPGQFAAAASPTPTLAICLPTSIPVTWWPEDGDSLDLLDRNNPSSTNAISFVPGQVGQGVTFGSGGFIEVPDASSLDLPQYTIEAWVRPDGPGPNDDVLVGPNGNIYGGSSIVQKDLPRPGGDSAASFLMNYSATHQTFLVGVGSLFDSSDTIQTGPLFPPGAFYHVAATYDGRLLTLYVNGSVAGQVAPSQPLAPDPTIPWTIGSTASPYRAIGVFRTWNGVIDEVKVWNRALSATEVAAIFHRGGVAGCSLPSTTTPTGTSTPTVTSTPTPSPGAGPSTISGQVLDASGEPVPGVVVSAGAGLSALTDAAGEYAIPNVPPGTYTLSPSKAAYTFSPPTPTVAVPPSATNQSFTASGDYVFAGPVDFALNPTVFYAGDVADTISLTIHHYGPTLDYGPVAVDFYQGDPSNGGTRLGRAVISAIAPSDVAASPPVTWPTVPAAGPYTLYAVIDPDHRLVQTDRSQNLVSRPVVVQPATASRVAPRMLGFTVNGGHSTTISAAVSLSAAASDEGGPGLGAFDFQEWAVDGFRGMWQEVADTPVNYDPTASPYPWTLTGPPGMHVLYAGAVDKNGVPSGWLDPLINYLPDPAHVHHFEQQDYSYGLNVGQVLDLKLESLTSGGDADIYVWAVDPATGRIARIGTSNLGPGQTDGIHLVVPWPTTYEIEVYGYVETDYRLRIAVDQTDVTTGGINLTKPLQNLPLIRPASLPRAPLGHRVYLPIVGLARPAAATTTK